jgi:RNA polymerase sigma-70 factor (ECF subfamily)
MSSVDEFRELQGLMFSVAYRMTGEVGDAEDIVQEAFLRLERTRREGVEVDSPKAWLSTATTRLAIDHLRSARVRRETYIGPWIPEPLLTDESPGPAEHAEVADSLSQAFLVVLETLTPVERAVFLLREVFGYGYAEIAEAVGKSEENCRQLAGRARRHVEARRVRFAADGRRHDELFDRFVEACETGDLDALEGLLAADAVLYSDGGGKARAARRPLYGANRIARMLVRVTRKRKQRGGDLDWGRANVNGQLSRLLRTPDGAISDVVSVDVADGLVQTVWIVRNPDKLRHLRTDDLP